MGFCGVALCERKSSFLKKRTKRLLFLSGGAGGPGAGRNLGATDKSFLVLFFKKELFFFPFRSVMHNAKEGRFAAEILRHLRAAVCVAEEMGPGLGAGALLFR
jgi:hypothetical protein